MPLPDPTFDPRRYRDILAEVMRRIPVHNPEWTNHSDSDPGVTILQLFSFLTESVIYRANRIPERNRLKFLRLLGVPMRPAGAARGLVAFSRPSGPLEALTLDAEQALFAGKIPFRTTRGLDVLPIESGVYWKRRLAGAEKERAKAVWGELYKSFEDPPGDPDSLDYYETRTLAPPKAGVVLDTLDVGAEAVDGLWIALFARRGEDPEDARRAIAGKTLSVGIVPALDAAALVLPPEGATGGEAPLPLLFETPNPTPPSGTGAAYRRLPAAADADPLTAPAIVEATLPEAEALRPAEGLEPLEAGTGDFPPTLEDEGLAARLVTWIRVRLPKESGDGGGQRRFRVSWVGINAAPVEQRASVGAELLPAGTGEPDQTATLANTPVLPETLRVLVNGEPWSRIDDLNAAPAEAPTAVRLSEGPAEPAPDAPPASAKVFALDPEAGEIRFGSGLAGARPPRGAVILAIYDYGGGGAGNVGIGSISKGTLPSGLRVTNPAPTWGGAAGETVAEAERRVPAFIANRDRLVTRDDFATIAAATPGVDIGRTEILPLILPEDPDAESPGVVTVLVVPATDPRNPRAPSPDRLFLDAVCRHLSPRRLVTTELHVRGPAYVDVWVSIAFETVAGRARAPVREAVAAAVERFLSPLTGGFAGTGWPLGRAVDAGEILVEAARVDGVARIDRVLLGDSGGERTTPRPLGRLELPRLAGLSVTADGEPTPIAEIAGTAPSGIAGPAATPVPVVPELC